MSFDPVVHAPHRLQVCALLAPVASLELGVVRDALDIPRSVLDAEVRILLDAGHLREIRPRAAARASRWIALTDPGRSAFARHLEELRRIAGTSPRYDSSDPVKKRA